MSISRAWLCLKRNVPCSIKFIEVTKIFKLIEFGGGENAAEGTPGKFNKRVKCAEGYETWYIGRFKLRPRSVVVQTLSDRCTKGFSPDGGFFVGFACIWAHLIIEGAVSLRGALRREYIRQVAVTFSFSITATGGLYNPLLASAKPGHRYQLNVILGILD